jgi:hypothetical protein
MTDITQLSRYQAAEYRRELLHALANPGLEFDMVGDQGKIDADAYKRKIAELDIYLATFD